MNLPSDYPEKPPDRARWILSRRGPRAPIDPWHPVRFALEQERSASGEVVSVATVVLASSECPWKCLMCDLWQHTLVGSVPLGAIPAQIDGALAQLPPARQIRLYNNGSFFDPMAVPLEDFPAIAARLQGFERVMVECHPSLIGETVLRLQSSLPGRLEVAMGLETIHPQVLERINKHMTPEQFSRAALYLHTHQVAVCALVLVKPPFQDDAEALVWARKSIDFAFDCGAEAVTLIPTRPGNGALEALAQQGAFSPCRLATLEAALAYGIGLNQGRVFADLGELDRFVTCAACSTARRERLNQMNLQQQVPPPVECAVCGARS